jgi:hypothetical protein
MYFLSPQVRTEGGFWCFYSTIPLTKFLSNFYYVRNKVVIVNNSTCRARFYSLNSISLSKNYFLQKEVVFYQNNKCLMASIIEVYSHMIRREDLMSGTFSYYGSILDRDGTIGGDRKYDILGNFTYIC